MLVLGFQKNQPVKKKVGKLFQVGVPPVGHGKPQSQALDLCQVPAAGLPVGRLVPKADGQDRAPDVRTGFFLLQKGTWKFQPRKQLLSVSMFHVYAR